MRQKLIPAVTLCMMILMINPVSGGETQWIAVGSLHNWYHSAGCEIEVGRTFQVSDQQDGLRWPAQFQDQDCQAAKAFWIGTTNYQDPLADKFYDYKVVHIGPRVLDESNEFMPVEFTMYGRYDTPDVFVDNTPASKLDFLERIDIVDPDLPAERLLYNVVNTGIGITMKRRIYAFSQQYNDNYVIYDYVFTNTGIVDVNGTRVNQTLTGVIFYFQYRYAISREGGPYGEGYWLPQSSAWGHNTMNDVIYTHPNNSGDPFRALISWHGKHSKWTGPGDNIGGPAYLSDGRLGAVQHVGVITLHADRAPGDNSDDINQPIATKEIGSDSDVSYNNSQFNSGQMTKEYLQYMSAGRPAESHATRVGDGFADTYDNTPGGFSTAQGYGPYTLAPGDSIHIVMAEAAAGINRDLVYKIGKNWLFDNTPFTLPDGGSTNDRNEYKNSWVYTGYDSLVQTFERARDNYASGFDIPQAPPPPEQLTVTSGGDRIILNWGRNAESSPNFNGYRVYRSIFIPDTTFDLVFACGPGTDNPQVVNEFSDTSPIRGIDYFYYVVAYDDGSTNTVQPGVPLESGKFYTMTQEPAFLRRPPGTSLDQIRIVPNPYNIKARDIQFGRDAGADRLMFYNIPPFCTIRIYTERGDLIRVLEHNDGSGDEAWNSLTSSRQVVVSGLYIAYIEVTKDYYDSVTGQKIYSAGDNVIKKFIIIR